MISFTEKNSPANVNEIESICKELGISEKNWLRKFWPECNGAVLEDQIVIYPTDQIVERNKTYEIDINFPEYILIGDDSGGGLILIPKKGLEKFYFIGSGDPFINDAEVFDSIEQLTAYAMADVDSDSDSGNIVSVAESKPKASDVLKIKKDFNLDYSIALLTKKLEKKDEIISENVKLIKYKSALKLHRQFVRFSSNP
ncbi:SMI1/KNR4 family protein [Pseudomonas syringae]|uniref:SMI1/KNR4 family protein n=1 Tax=Pseudomonas TaxID=286 RepID=UPI000BB6184C|nr:MULTISPECIES: SMI1/KNR4 family protein [Pseudomonas]MCH5512230.1 SMI1/KNR4 family protein [Pseudomonas syringae pv. syringae]MCH5640942.1 SMI1/KNR4 family protein [Pseudomonas syringae pv. syringae]MCH7430081.1 SMI1/KNR4 family protein [Pseudomonas syringae pv. syringae]MDF5776606.1 SMI1/KNR4 family protein [Pseudomonas syringae pv. syringae]PBP78345.1 SMI1/KNR4 family protein [Pseudomonas syringae]